MHVSVTTENSLPDMSMVLWRRQIWKPPTRFSEFCNWYEATDQMLYQCYIKCLTWFASLTDCKTDGEFECKNAVLQGLDKRRCIVHLCGMLHSLQPSMPISYFRTYSCGCWWNDSIPKRKEKNLRMSRIATEHRERIRMKEVPWVELISQQQRVRQCRPTNAKQPNFCYNFRLYAKRIWIRATDES